MAPVRIENWSVKFRGDLYTPPECTVRALSGEVYGHPLHEDGNKVTTSKIVSSIGRIITTLSREYELGEIDPEYLQWMNDNGIKFDPENPITFKEIAQ